METSSEASWWPTPPRCAQSLSFVLACWAAFYAPPLPRRNPQEMEAKREAQEGGPRPSPWEQRCVLLEERWEGTDRGDGCSRLEENEGPLGPLSPPFLLAGDWALALGGELQARWWPHGGRQRLFLEQIYGSAWLSHEILLKLREALPHWWPLIYPISRMGCKLVAIGWGWC